jgi:hypothetical protein
MARLGHWGAESGHQHAEGLTATGAIIFDTALKRSGTQSFKFESSAANYLTYTFTAVNSRSYYACGYFRLPAATGLPGSTATILGFGVGRYCARLTSAGKVHLAFGTTQIGSDSAATIVADTWYRLELFANHNTAGGADDSAEVRLDGVSVGSETNVARTAVVVPSLDFGWLTDPGTAEVIHWDDIALNDDQGSTNNTWVGDHAVVCLLPTADSAIGNWKGGDNSDVTNIFENVDNTPPVGTAANTNGNQIINSVASADNDYDATMQSYTAAGVGADDTVKALYGVWVGGSNSTTGSDTLQGSIDSNPVVAAVSSSCDANSGTYPTGWTRGQTGISEDPTVTKGTAPVMQIRKVVSNTRENQCCFMGIMVSYSPTPAVTARRYFSVISVN